MGDFQCYPSLLEWPTAVADIRQAPITSSRLRLVSKTINFNSLLDLSNLEELWCFDIGREQLEVVFQCSRIRRLYIDGFGTDVLRGFEKLPSLEVLSLESNSKVTSLGALADRSNLRGLGIIHFKNVHSLEEIATLVNLKSVAITGSMWTPMTLETLDPLSEMGDLEELDLGNVRVRDKSLKGLAGLQRLKNLNVANFFPVEEFGWLSKRLEKTKCTWFEPYIDFEYGACKKCGKQTMVMLSGRGTSLLCKVCDSTRLAKHIDKFNKAADLN